MSPTVSVVIVTYNSPEWVERCLKALLDDARPQAPTQVVVVDSGSEQPTRDLLARWADRVDLHLSAENIGFARGCNLGVARSTGEYVLLLNPDAVVEPGCVDALLEDLTQNPGTGILGGRTLRPDGVVDPSSCWGAPTLWSWFCFAVGLSTALRRHPVFDPESLGGWQRDSRREVAVVTGCLLMTTRETWDRLGGLDEDYFMYGEDADLSLRAAELGLRPAITPAAVATHAVGASSGRKAHKNRLLMTGKATLARKRWSRPRAAAGIALLRLGVLLRGTGELVRRSADPTWVPLLRDGSWTRGWVGRAARSTESSPR